MKSSFLQNKYTKDGCKGKNLHTEENPSLCICVFVYRGKEITALGCDFFDSKTNTQINKRIFRNIFFRMVSFVFSGDAL
jgi:hypothetical protein